VGGTAECLANLPATSGVRLADMLLERHRNLRDHHAYLGSFN
jgi:hypothetical protein